MVAGRGMNKSQSAPLLHLPKLSPNQIPNLPGNCLDLGMLKTKHTKSQIWGYINGQRMEVKEGLSFDRPKFVRAPKPVDTWRKGSLPNSVYKDIFVNPQYPKGDKNWELAPAWDVFDRHVLRFYGFGKEEVTEFNLQNNRVRKITILYYLEDDTMHVLEPKVSNSGCGVFASAGGLQDKGLSSCLVRRHRVPATGDDSEDAYLTQKNLRLGEDIEIYGRLYRLYDCDPFTREYYQSIGCPQPTDYAPKEAPRDEFDEVAQQIRPAFIKPPRTVEKRYSETQLGGGHINKNLQQFMETSRKVCRFYAMVDDLTTGTFERRPFIILFFLYDNTVEIREQYPINCGRENFPVFIKRQPLPKSITVEVRGPMDPVYGPDEYITIHDFDIGKTVRMANLDFLVYDADEFTRRYFQDELKIAMEDKLDVRLATIVPPRPSTPPYTGYGSWADSMGSVKHLVPKPPRKDIQKLFANAGKVLRFSAKFAGHVCPEDLDRRFVFAYYLMDDTVSIYEPPQRNLGIVTGKFLEKGIHCNQETAQLFKPDDLLPGKTSQVLSRKFIMLDTDEFTKKWFEAKEAKVPMGTVPANLDSVLAKIRESFRQQLPLMRDTFRRFDVDRNGVLCYFEFDRVLQKFAFKITPEETLCIMRHFDKDNNGQVSYNEFCDTVFDEDYTQEMLPMHPTVDAEMKTIMPYAEKAITKTIDRSEQEKIRLACKAVGQVMYSRPGLEFRLREDFRQTGISKMVTPKNIRDAFLRLGITFELEDVDRAVQYLMRPKEFGNEKEILEVDYNDFLMELKCTYHDLAKMR